MSPNNLIVHTECTETAFTFFLSEHFANILQILLFKDEVGEWNEEREPRANHILNIKQNLLKMIKKIHKYRSVGLNSSSAPRILSWFFCLSSWQPARMKRRRTMIVLAIRFAIYSKNIAWERCDSSVSALWEFWSFYMRYVLFCGIHFHIRY